jgi:medium-chain acyl-[acyl-carrier-protein] hydrolase
MHKTPRWDHWIVKPRPNPEATWRLFCFPYAGGSAQIFRRWPQQLPATGEVCALELPGRGTRLQEPLFTHLPLLVEAMAQPLAQHLEKPFAFFGHSMGALLSFEMARYCRRQRLPGPVHLFVSGRRAPHLPPDEPPLYNLPEPALIDELRRLNGTPEEVLEHAELMQLMLPILRADFAVCDTYQYTPEPPLSCPITVFSGLQDTSVRADHLEAWCAQTQAACSVHLFPGDHFFLHTTPSLLLQTLARALPQLQDRCPVFNAALQ